MQNVISTNNNDNNIMSASVSYDNTGRYNYYKITSMGNSSVSGGSGATDLDSLVSRSGGISDTNIRSGRTLIIDESSAYSNEDCINRAKWEANVRRARGRLYTVTVHGYSYDGLNLWELNKLVQIKDVFCSIYEPMLVNAINFNIDSSEGATTEITFVERNSYTLTFDDPTLSDFT